MRHQAIGYDVQDVRDKIATAYRTGVSGADAVTTDTALTTNPILPVGERSTLYVAILFSTAAANVDVSCVSKAANTGAGVGRRAETQNADASAFTTGAGGALRYLPLTILAFDTAGVPFVELRFGAPSAGTVDAYAWMA